MSLLLIVAIIIIVFIVSTGYVKAPTDKAFIISGLRKQPKIVIGRATIKIPFLERKDEWKLKIKWPCLNVPLLKSRNS